MREQPTERGAASDSGGVGRPNELRLPERPEALGPERGGGAAAWIWGAAALVAAALVVFLVWGPKGTLEELIDEPHPALGRTLAGLQLEPLVDVEQSLELADLSDKQAVLINFWGPWCHWCMVEMPDLLEVRDAFESDDRFELVFVSSGGGKVEDVNNLRSESTAALQRFNNPPPSYYDPDARSRLALVQTAQLQGFGYPTTVLIDGDGVIHGLWTGYSPDAAAEMEQGIKRLLGDG